MNMPARRVVLLAVLGAALVMLIAMGLALLGWRQVGLADEDHQRAFVATLCVSGALWLLAVAVVRRGPLPARAIWLVLAVAVAMRLLTLFAPPVLSSDVYRYVWDGRVQLAGVNPYRYVPAAERLAPLRDDVVYPQINRADYAPTIYPPGAQAIFALAAAVTPGVFGMKLMMAAFDLLTLAVLFALLRAAGRPPAELLIYAWLPLPVWEFAGNAHIDAAAAGLLSLALLLSLRSRWLWTGVVLGFATLTKFLPAAVLPAFWRPWNWRLPLAYTVTLVALYIPYVSVGSRVFGFLGGYASEEGFHDGNGVFLLQLLDHVVALPDWSFHAYAALVLGLLGAIAMRFAFGGQLPATPAARVAVQARQAVILGAVVLAALSPHYPWYFGWIAPLACLAPLPAVLWMLAAAPLLAHGAFEYLAIPGSVYIPAAILAAIPLFRPVATPPAPQVIRSVS